MNPTVSIIVPVYNAESSLSRCVDSILGQEYQDFELLLADDGSTDRSGSICDAYAASDSRVKVIHKSNTGVSDTRNTAISHACGTYLQFLDSDDWITPDATKLFVRAVENTQCDMVIADFYRVVGERVSHKGDIDDNSVLTREEFAGHMMKNPADFYYGVIWNKLYRRDIVEKYNLRMNTELSWCEDFLFNLEYILHAETFYALKAPVYYYVKTKGSLISQSATIVNSVRMKLTVFEYYNRFYKHVLDEKEYEKNRFQVYRFLIGAAKDGAVPPSILPGATKLGRERTGSRNRRRDPGFLLPQPQAAGPVSGNCRPEIRAFPGGNPDDDVSGSCPPDQYKEGSGRLHRHDHARPDTYASEAGSKKADPGHGASRREENKIRRPRPFSAQAPGYCISFRFEAHSSGTPDRTE